MTLTEWFAYWDSILGTPGMCEQVAAPVGRMVFTMLDQDGDGSVTGDEYAAVYKYGGLDPAEANSAFTRLDLANGFFGVAPALVG